MRFGLSSFALPWTIGLNPDFSPFDLLDAARDVGANGVQICDNLPLGALSVEDLRRLRVRAEELELYLQVGMRGLHATDVRVHLAIARHLGSTLLRAVIDGETYQPGHNEITTVLHDLSEDFSAGDVVLGLENHDRFTAIELRSVIETVDQPWLGVCLDTANSLGAGEGLGEVLPVLGPLTVNLHIKDFCVRRMHHNLGFVVEGTPAGSGFIHWPDVLGALSPEITCALELWTPQQASPAESAALEARFLAQSAAYLHGLQL